MTESKFLIINLIMMVFIFFISLLLATFYVNGDQIYYNMFYNNLQYLNFYDGLDFYKYALSSREYVYFLLVWVFSFFGVSHIVFVAFFNAILSYFIVKLFYDWKVNIWIILTFVFTNYYMLVLYFSAERLKFGILFIIVSLLYLERPKSFIFYLILSVMSHAQMIILYASLFINVLLKNIFIGKGYKFAWYILPLAVVVYFSYDQVVLKLNSYKNIEGIEDFYKTNIFLLLALYYSKNKLETVTLFIPLFVVIYFVGDMRVNIFSYFLFLFYALRVNNGLNFGVVTTSIYYGTASISYIYNVLIHGDGFYCG